MAKSSSKLTWKKIALAVVILALLWVGLRWPRREFRSWSPPKAPPLTGPYAPNKKLHQAQVLGGPTMVEPEDVAIDAKGRIYGSCIDGVIRRVDASGKKAEAFAKIPGGRPLGILFDAQGNLLVADALKGLLSIDPKGQVRTLASRYKGEAMRFVDDLDIDAKGRIYFSDVSTLYTFNYDTRPEIMARVPTGRLFRYDPKTKALKLLLDDLHFANGVALSHSQEYVLVTETSDYSIRRYWLAGPKAGQSDVFAKNLPGYPDNINRSSRGGYWVALTSMRLSHVDAMMHPRAWLKKLIMTLPKALLPKPIKASFVVHLDGQGRPTESLQDPDGSTIPNATSATEYKGHLYLGHIYHKATGIARLELPAAKAPAPRPGQKAAPTAKPAQKAAPRKAAPVANPPRKAAPKAP